MVRVADGDRGAVEPLFVLLWPVVHAFADRMLTHGADAPDAAQEALLKVFKQAAAFDAQRGDAVAWALGIAAWECRTVLRRQHRRKEAAPEALVAHPAPQLDPAEAATRQNLLDALAAAVGQLQPPDMDTVAHVLAGVHPCGVHPDAFRKRVQRVLKRLRTVWRVHHGES